MKFQFNYFNGHTKWGVQIEFDGSEKTQGNLTLLMQLAVGLALQFILHLLRRPHL